jgi:hypothetical protein
MKKDERKVYARLDTTYKDLVIPMHLLDQILCEGYLVRTTFTDGAHVIEKIDRIHKTEFHDQEEIDVALAQNKLENAS